MEKTDVKHKKIKLNIVIIYHEEKLQGARREREKKDMYFDV